MVAKPYRAEAPVPEIGFHQASLRSLGSLKHSPYVTARRRNYFFMIDASSSTPSKYSHEKRIH